METLVQEAMDEMRSWVSQDSPFVLSKSEGLAGSSIPLSPTAVFCTGGSSLCVPLSCSPCDLEEIAFARSKLEEAQQGMGRV